MSADRFDQMLTFVRVAEAGGFSAAARSLGATQSSVSKSVSALETRLGVRLLNRTTRALSLTDEGRRYVEAARAALDAASVADASVAGAARASGVLRMAAPLSFGETQIVPRFAEFRRRHPGVEIDLQLSDHFIDIVSEGIELAIRVGEMSDSTLVARRLGAARRVCVAAPDYLNRRGTPVRPEDLGAHDFVVYTRLSSPEIPFFSANGAVSVSPRGPIRIDTSIGVRAAVAAGLGVGCNPLWLYAHELRTGRVVEILQDFAPEPLPIFAVTPARSFTPLRVLAMADFLEAEFRADPYLAGGDSKARKTPSGAKETLPPK